jgi:hypothetical protein
MTISLEPELLQASSNLPENVGRANLSLNNEKDGPFRRSGCVPLFGLAPGDAYRAVCVTTAAVGSYPTFSPLPDRRSPSAFGGLFSVAPVSDRSAWALPSTLPFGVRTFLPQPQLRAVIRPTASPIFT